MIQPIVADQFYEANFDLLVKQIEACFQHELGPGETPSSRKKKELCGIIAPHAGYQASGPCAAWAYKAVAESKFPKTFVIIAPDHNGIHDAITVCDDKWMTPMGVVNPDKEFIEKLLVKCDFIKKGVIREHAVEVQLPFLQYSCKDKIRELKIVPIVMPSDINYRELGEAIPQISEDVCVIASSDFTHFGPSYGFTPFKYNVKKGIYRLDGNAVSFVKKMDAEGFLSYWKKSKATICGAPAIASALVAVKELFAKKGDLLSYYTSGDISGDYTNAVGYAAVKFA